MSALGDSIREQHRGHGPVCGMRRLLTSLPKDEAADLAAALADDDVTASAISRALTSLGHKVGPFPVQRHRRGDCGCTP